MAEKPNVLVTGHRSIGTLEALQSYAKVYWLDDMGGPELDKVLPSVECVLVQTWWPESLTPERVSKMTRLRFIQSGMAGVNHIPFKDLGRAVVVSSNAGGFSQGVGEFAIALLLAASKRVVKLDHSLRTGEFDPAQLGRLFRDILPTKGRTLGVLGFGGIGRVVGSMGRGIGMEVIAYSRHSNPEAGVPVFQGREGLLRVLGGSDAVVIALPLSRLTTGLIGRKELGAMKRDAVLVNVARAEIVDEEAIYKHLTKNELFTYATDVWLMENGKETYKSKFPLLKLSNFIGTPHVAGGGAAKTGEPERASVENLVRYLKGELPRNVVDPSEYA